ncbi:hypothetical protein EUX98_g9635 [Antrodiella citrinella]|uniref:Uncharacterized protein n=1 Tax=Antrodiella citrinella TaxID=2447956 RepID=A0A4S4LQK6_9APHY|nr:hypothetical protein EUX98_g9635 [Antrodiella citrinella]
MARIQDELQFVILRRHVNSFAPIFHIPPEILSEIMLSLMHFYLHPWLSEPKHPQDPEDPVVNPYVWMTYTHVCHHWRSIALNCPELWSIFVVRFMPLDAVETMILRSGEWPLTIVGDVGTDSDSDNDDDLTLDTGNDNDNDSMYLGVLNNDPSLLAALGQLHRTHEVVFAREPGHIDLNLDNAPLLRRFKLFGPSMWQYTRPALSPSRGIQFLQYTALTHVVLGSWTGTETPSELLQMLFRVLRGLDRLQYLKIAYQREDRESYYDEICYDTWDDVSLPCLQDMILTYQDDYTEHWVPFLQHLTVPTTTRFVISVFSDADPPECLDMIVVLQEKLESLEYGGQYEPGVSWPLSHRSQIGTYGAQILVRNCGAETGHRP